MYFDFLIVGAGFSGLTFAECAARILGATSLIVDRRCHIGGNAFDRYDRSGVLIHPFGPHYFRTNSLKIRSYLSRFTEWHPVDYKILSYTEGRYWKFPINLNTFEQILGRASSTTEMAAWLDAKRVHIPNPTNSEEVVVSQIGWELYEKFFKGYTLKQWKKHPSELDPSVCGRIPIRTVRDDRYLAERFQALPAAGYHTLFENILDACGRKVALLLNTDFRDVLPSIRHKHLVYTGPIDEFFDHRFGRLPYRSLHFEFESFTAEQLKKRESISGKPGFWQPAMQVNYPNDEAYTRIVELKHATGQACSNTTIVREFPADYSDNREPFYPVPTADSKLLYQQYKTLADSIPNTTFLGRLATYRYYNMDQVVGMALSTFDQLLKQKRLAT
jgi:UDP-galactopyranose mutase